MSHNSFVLTCAAVAGLVAQPICAGIRCSGESAQVRVDLATGTRIAAETETLTYSADWFGGDSVKLVSNGTTLRGAAALAGAGTYTWTPAKAGTNTLKHETYQEGTLKDTLTATFEVMAVEVTTDDAVVAGTTVAVTDGDGQLVEAQTEGKFAGKLIVASNSTVTVTWTTEEGKYFADGSTTYAKSFKADKLLNPAGEAVVKPEGAKAPTVQLGKVAQRYPWNGQIDVEYKVSNVPAGAYKLELTAECGGVSCGASVNNVKLGIGTAVITTKGRFPELVSKNCRISAELVKTAPPK